MANIIVIAGFSGSGKSTSMMRLDAKETFIISVAGKKPNFPGFKVKYTTVSKSNPNGNYMSAMESEKIIASMNYVNNKRTDIKTLIIDDVNYSMSGEAMDRSSEKGYDKHTEMANNYYQIFNHARNLRDDLVVIFMSHLEAVGSDLEQSYKLLTLGKMLDKTVNIDGLFETTLYCEKITDANNKLIHVFRTKSNGPDTCKTPIGMFDKKYIPNDLKYVLECFEKHANRDMTEEEMTIDMSVYDGLE